MLEKLAVWYLRKKDVTVILNCKFNEPITIKTKGKVYHHCNDYISGTAFLFANGNKLVIQKLEEMEEND